MNSILLEIFKYLTVKYYVLPCTIMNCQVLCITMYYVLPCTIMNCQVLCITMYYYELSSTMYYHVLL